MAYQQDQNSYGQPLAGYPVTAGWSSTEPTVASIGGYGDATALDSGITYIRGTWDGQRRIPEIGNEECNYESIIIVAEDPVEIRPRVTSIGASLPSTRNAATGQRPDPGAFTTTNTSTAFATGTSPSDLLVTFQSSDADLTIIALGNLSTTAANSLKWKIDRDPNDIGLTGTPALNTQTGRELTVTPNTSGNFRLICYYDANGNGVYNSGEELKVLRLAVVKASIDTSECTVTASGSFSSPTSTSVGTANAMRLECDVVLESGGSDKRVGLDKVKLGNVGNLISDNFTVHYPAPPPAREVEAPGGDLPMIDTSRVNQGQEPTGGITAFRASSRDPSAPRAAGGQTRSVASGDSPGFRWDLNHPITMNIWETTSGSNKFREFVVGYTETFPRNYVGLAKAEWEVIVIGRRSRGLSFWTEEQGAAIQLNMPISSLISGGTPQSGDTAGVQVLGKSFRNESRMQAVVP